MGLKNMELTITKLGPLSEPAFIPGSIQPPSGSDWDQVLDVEPLKIWYIVGGDPTQFLCQGVKNSRSSITGFGMLLGHLGGVTNPLIFGICTNDQRINHIYEPDYWSKYGILNPGDIDPGYWYWIWATFPESPVNIPAGETFYLAAVTNEPWVTDHAWRAGGQEGNPYTPAPLMVWNNISWYTMNDDLDFFTFTETAVGGAIGTILPSSQWYNGPFNPGTTDALVAKLDYKNDGDITGWFHIWLYANPGTANEQFLKQWGTANLSPGQSATQQLHVNVPNTPGQPWPLGVKLWSNTEPEPSWGSYNTVLWG